MTPRCETCGRFTTHYTEIYLESSHPYAEGQRWLCREHTP